MSLKDFTDTNQIEDNYAKTGPSNVHKSVNESSDWGEAKFVA